MKHWKLAAAALFCLPLFLGAQEDRKTQDDKKMPTFTPSKEHQLLKQFDGDWEFTSKCTMPGMEPMEGKGTETSRLTYGSFWLDCEDKGVMAGKDWSGRAIMGWDPQKKQFVGV